MTVALTLAGSTFFEEGLLLLLSFSLLSFLDLALSSATAFLPEARSLLAGRTRSERLSLLLRLRGGEGGEGERRLPLRGGLLLLSLLSMSRCLYEIGLLARLEGEGRLGLDLLLQQPSAKQSFEQALMGQQSSVSCQVRVTALHCTAPHRIALHCST